MHPPFFLFLAWQPSWLEVGITGHNFGRGPSKDHSTKVSLQLAQWFLRRRLKCESLRRTDDGRQVMAKAHLAKGFSTRYFSGFHTPASTLATHMHTPVFYRAYMYMNSSYIKMWKLKKDRENEEKYDWWCVCVDVLLVNQLDIKNTDWWCVCVDVLLVNLLDIKMIGGVCVWMFSWWTS